MLMPAAVLVLIVLASIAVDQSVVFTQQRDLVAGAQAAANDAAGYGLDKDSFYGRDEIVFDQQRAVAAARGALRARGIDEEPIVTLSPDRRLVTVQVRSRADYIFAKAIPGAPDTQAINGTASAELVVG